MKTIYIDTDFKCHTVNDGTMQAVETDYFDNKCEAFINGYRYIPLGESWTRADGVTFNGEMIAPSKSFNELDAAQREYELALLEEYKVAFNMVMEGATE